MMWSVSSHHGLPGQNLEKKPGLGRPPTCPTPGWLRGHQACSQALGQQLWALPLDLPARKAGLALPRVPWELHLVISPQCIPGCL